MLTGPSLSITDKGAPLYESKCHLEVTVEDVITFIENNMDHVTNRCFAMTFLYVLGQSGSLEAKPTLPEVEFIQAEHRAIYKQSKKEQFLSDNLRTKFNVNEYLTPVFKFKNADEFIEVAKQAVGFHLSYPNTFMLSLGNKRDHHVMAVSVETSADKPPRYTVFDSAKFAIQGENLNEILKIAISNHPRYYTVQGVFFQPYSSFKGICRH